MSPLSTSNVEQGLFNNDHYYYTVVLYPIGQVGDPSSSGVVVYMGSGFAALIFIIVMVVNLTVTVVYVGKKKIEVNGTHLIILYI